MNSIASADKDLNGGGDVQGPSKIMFDVYFLEIIMAKKTEGGRQRDCYCPHCGAIFLADLNDPCPKTPTHDFPKFCRSVCVGSKKPLLMNPPPEPKGLN